MGIGRAKETIPVPGACGDDPGRWPRAAFGIGTPRAIRFRGMRPRCRTNPERAELAFSASLMEGNIEAIPGLSEAACCELPHVEMDNSSVEALHSFRKRRLCFQYVKTFSSREGRREAYDG